MISFVLFLSVALASYLFHIQYHSIKNHLDAIFAPDIEGELVIGEENVDNGVNNLVADHVNEFYRIIDSNQSWTIESVSKYYHEGFQLLIQSRKATGVYSSRRVPVLKARWFVKNCSARSLFTLLTSKEGYAIIDPVIPLVFHFKSAVTNVLFFRQHRSSRVPTST
jgi:hypothetical protein